jgi:predicted PurR-regulated permease PerM
MNGREVALWIIGSGVLLALMYVGQPLLVPLVFSLLLWAVVNAMVEALVALRVPRAISLTVAVLILVLAMWVMLQVLANQAASLAAAIPGYGSKLSAIVTRFLVPLHVDVKPSDIVHSLNIPGYLTGAAASVGSSLFAVIQVLVYLGFLLGEQHLMEEKVARLQRDDERHNEIRQVVRQIARQIQAYLGVCTILSAIMGAATWILLAAMGVQFAGFWAVVIFLLTYVPTIGAVGVVFPGLMALVQFGNFTGAIVIVTVLGALHFILLNVAENVILGKTLNLSPFAIIISLTFWGLVWGVAGLFLAVPVTGAIAIVCNHIEKLRWIAVLLAGPPTSGHARHPLAHTAHHQHHAT